MPGRAQLAPPGLHGWDINRVVTPAMAAAFAAADYRFALRYIRRSHAAATDLSAGEVAALHAEGHAVSIVQHFGPTEGWEPTEALGATYGTNAADACRALGVPAGVTVWLDLEGVAAGIDPDVIVAYCNAWSPMVRAAGFEPGVYVGWGAGLTPDQLYRRLFFIRYMAAYNLNSDQYPAVRGVCMKQRSAQAGDMPPGFPHLSIDVDDVRADALGGLPTMWFPD